MANNGKNVSPAMALYYAFNESTVTIVTESDTGSDIIREQASEYFLFQLATNVHKYWLITMAGLGIVGNIISLIVMRQVRQFQFTFL